MDRFVHGGARRPFLAVALALVVVIVGLLLARVAVHRADIAVHDRMVAIATRTADPAGVTPLVPGKCPDTTYLIRCATSEQDADTLAAFYVRALSASSGQKATSSCETLRFGPKARSCLVRFDERRHAVLISIDSTLKRTSGKPEFIGSRLRIDAD